MMRRTLPRILLCLMLGVVTTVGVAWLAYEATMTPQAAALRHSGFVVGPGAPPQHKLQAWVSESLGHTQVHIVIWTRARLDQLHPLAFHSRNTMEWEDLPEWSRVRAGDFPLNSGRMEGGYEDLVGWPFLCLRRWDITWLPIAEQPALIMPVGFVSNILFYTVGWAALFWLVVDGRRFIRRRRGRCVNCAYNLRGNTSGVCPECGAAIQGRRCK